MSSKKLGLAALTVTALALTVYVVTANAQQPGTGRTAPTHATITGRVVDLHCFMTGQFPSADHAKCTADCIRQGVPSAIETADGLVIVGQGFNSAAKAMLPFAFQEVEAKGKLYTKGNMKYLDLTAIQELADSNEEEDEGSEE